MNPGWFVTATLVLGCANITGAGKPAASEVVPKGSDTGAHPSEDCAALHVLEIVPLDIWGRDLDAIEVATDATPWVTAGDLGPGVVWVPALEDGTVVNVTVSASDHETTQVQLRFEETEGGGWWEPSTPTRNGEVITSFSDREIEGASCPVTQAFIGIDHQWFSAAGTAPSRNNAELLMSGAEFFGAVAEELEVATERVNWTTWWWESDFELIRPDNIAELPEYVRRQNTAMHVLNALDGTERRLLINRFWGDNLDWTELITADEELRNVAEHGLDGFEVILQGNSAEVPTGGEFAGTPTGFVWANRVRANPRYTDTTLAGGTPTARLELELQVASWHQKFIAIDGRVGFVTGMNTKLAAWDTFEHLIFDPRRMAFDTSEAEREAVSAGEAYPDAIPRRDYGIRLEGPAVHDLERMFQSRWDLGIDEHDGYSEHATAYDIDDAPAEVSAGVPVQIVHTLPEPWSDMGIWDAHEKALSNAEDYVYIEDQYFRAPELNDELLARMNADPDLLITVVTNDVPWWDGGLKYTYLSDTAFREAFGDRYQMFQLRAAALTTVDGWLWDDVTLHQETIWVHSKLRIIDDRFSMVGSANFSNRSLKYDGETNAHVLDETFATQSRRAIFENLVGPEFDHLLNDDPAHNFEIMRVAAEYNADVIEWWETNGSTLTASEADAQWEDYQPSGFLYPLTFEDGFEIDVGPDMF